MHSLHQLLLSALATLAVGLKPGDEEITGQIPLGDPKVDGIKLPWEQQNDNTNNPFPDLELEDEYSLPPSWQGPSHCVGEYCLFSNPTFGTDGIAMVTTPQSAWISVNFRPVADKTVESTAYSVAPIPGKGLGIVANRLIKKGEIIMQRTPAVMIHSKPHVELQPEVREKVYEAMINALSETAREKFLAQYGDTVRDKIDNNAFRMFVGDDQHEHESHLGSFPEIARINHDCRPNLHYRLTNITHTTVAVRDIPAGEELTISYIYGQASKKTRTKELQDWGFNCSCSQCTLSGFETAASDARVREIKRLEKEIEDKMTKGGKEIKPEMAGKLVQLYLDERLHAYLAPTYTRAALIYSMFGNEEKARELATEAVGALTREYGAHAKDIPSMRQLAENPKGHWSWGIKVVSEEPKKKWKLGGKKQNATETVKGK
ncbi:hypothetical protein QBC35DRAFT_468890 [Podospora australis]|uniref:SET domain-containing protein n=1 Tax=Podospora australis TaxID=1536484 RepID=A0AAN6X8E4_9PEZI|nr:hypothetical protein QBC35DRAFT_468890 [Podospora australis]